MKRSVIVLLLLTLAVAARAGRPLEKSLHGSAVVEVYRLTADDMRALADEEPLTHDMLSRYVGSYDAFDALPALDRGNYVVVRRSRGGYIRSTICVRSWSTTRM